jgi:hypothetical protein
MPDDVIGPAECDRSGICTIPQADDIIAGLLASAASETSLQNCDACPSSGRYLASAGRESMTREDEPAVHRR